ncbi:MAG TPA: IS110 family transposase [Acidimicrobiales bacterium]|nr:IS110 family transposase [Acidimicrobiales bacterium]
MTAVMIGVDPHKGSHTAMALDEHELILDVMRVRSSTDQAQRLLTWARRWPTRTWAIEGAAGLGYLLAQQLVAAGEKVLDVQPKLAARVRLLENGDVNKNDPNDARSVAIAALRSKGLTQVTKEDHTAVMKVWVRRRRELSRSRNRVANRLHALLLELVPGGLEKEISAARVAKLLETIEPTDAVGQARKQLAEEQLSDLRRIDAQQKEVDTRLGDVVAASRTTTTDLFGVGPVVAGMVLGMTGNVRRFSSCGRFASYNGTAPIEASSGPHKVYRLSRRGNRQLNHAIHMAAVTQIRHRHSEGRAYYDRKIAEGKSPKMALRALKRRISDALYTAMVSDAQRDEQEQDQKGSGGQKGNGSVSSVTSSHPRRRFFGQATPEPASTVGRSAKRVTTRPNPASSRRRRAS